MWAAKSSARFARTRQGTARALTMRSAARSSSSTSRPRMSAGAARAAARYCVHGKSSAACSSEMMIRTTPRTVCEPTFFISRSRRASSANPARRETHHALNDLRDELFGRAVATERAPHGHGPVAIAGIDIIDETRDDRTIGAHGAAQTPGVALGSNLGVTLLR